VRCAIDGHIAAAIATGRWVIGILCGIEQIPEASLTFPMAGKSF
jgi:hypothetical protein